MKWLFIAVVVPASIVLPIGAAWWKYASLSLKEKYLLVYLLLSAVVNLAAVMLAARHVNNLPLLHVYTAIEFVLLAVFYRYALSGRLLRITLLVAMVVFPLACLFNAWFIQSPYVFNTYTRSLEAVTLIVVSLYSFHQLIGESKDIRIWQQPVFWFSAGLFLYFAGALLLFISATFMIGNRQLDVWAWRLHAFLVFLMYIFFTIGFFYAKRNR